MSFSHLFKKNIGKCLTANVSENLQRTEKNAPDAVIVLHQKYCGRTSHIILPISYLPDSHTCKSEPLRGSIRGNLFKLLDHVNYVSPKIIGCSFDTETYMKYVSMYTMYKLMMSITDLSDKKRTDVEICFSKADDELSELYVELFYSGSISLTDHACDSCNKNLTYHEKCIVRHIPAEFSTLFDQWCTVKKLPIISSWRSPFCHESAAGWTEDFNTKSTDTDVHFTFLLGYFYVSFDCA